MVAYGFSQPWLSKIDEEGLQSTALEFAHLRDYLKGIDNGTIPLYNLNTIYFTANTATIANLTVTTLNGGSVANREDYVVGTALNNYTGSTTVFNLTGSYNVGGHVLIVTVDGDVQTVGATIDYVETNSTTVTFNNALVATQKVSFIYPSTPPSAAGTVNSGTSTHLAYYASTGTAVSDASTATISGTYTLSGTVTISGQGIIKGTATNDSAAAGYVGEYISSTASDVSFPTTGQYGDATSISLTAGDWDVSVNGNARVNGATVTDWEMGASVTSGNSSAGTVTGDSRATGIGPVATANSELCLSGIRFSLSGTTIVYFKYYADFTVATPKMTGRISARRVR